MKSKVIFLLVGLVMASFSYSAKAQSKYGEDSASCVVNISLFREAVKKKNYEEAYPFWKAVLDSCPMSTKNVFINGVPILDYKIKQAKKANDSDAMNKYIQDLLDLYELRMQYYPSDEGYCLGQIGSYLAKYRLQDEYVQSYEYLKKSVALSTPASLTASVLDTYFKVAEYYMKRSAIEAKSTVYDTSIMINAYDEITEVLDAAVEDREEDFQKVMDKIFKLREQLDSQVIQMDYYEDRYGDLAKDSAKAFAKYNSFRIVSSNIDNGFSKYGNCEVLTEIYGKKMEQSKDEKTLRQIIKLFNKKGCTKDNQTYISAVREIHEIAPTAQTAFYMGVISLKDEKFDEAENYFNEALSLYQKTSDSIRVYLNLGQVSIFKKQFSSARDYAYKALRMNPSNAEAYILIGDAYLFSGCNTEIPGAFAWAAADKYNKAMSLTSSLKDNDPKQAQLYERAQSGLSSAASRFPKAEVYFQRGFQKGQSYRVDCWINETTTIR